MLIVTPTASEADDIDPTGALTSNVMNSINLLSRMSNSNYVSVRGEAIQKNFLSARQRVGCDDEDVVLSSVQDSMTAMIDDILVGYGVSQIAYTNDAREITAQVLVQGMSIGRPFYIYLIFAINCILLFVLCFEAFRTQRWSDLPTFDYANVKCAIFAASHGKDSLADDIYTRNVGPWDGGPDNKVFSRTDMILSYKNWLPQSVAANQSMQLHLTSSDHSGISGTALLGPGYLSNPLANNTSLDSRSRSINFY